MKNISNRGRMTTVQHGRTAARVMAEELVAEHKRWRMPLLSWENGKIVKTHL